MVVLSLVSMAVKKFFTRSYDDWHDPFISSPSDAMGWLVCRAYKVDG
jgi:hypothetical protein